MSSLDPSAVAKAIKASVGRKHPDSGKLTIKKHSDGQSLYLLTRDGLGWWQYQWREGDTSRSKILGSAADLSPLEARKRREAMATKRREGAPPERLGVINRKAKRKPRAGAGKSFGEVVTEYLEGYWLPGKEGADPAWMPGAAESWGGGLEGGEARSYRRTLLKHGGIASRPVARIDTSDVQHHLAEWNNRPVTRDKVRSRIQVVLNNAKSRGLYDFDNPATTAIFKNLPGPKKPKVEHHAAMLSSDVPAFMVDLLAVDTVAARALAFTILTAARTKETLGMRWREVDFKNKVWIVSPERMKEKEEHRVPLTPQALKLIGKPGKPDDHVFPSPNKGPAAPIWNKAMTHLLHKFLSRGMISAIKGRCPVPHGFRTTFSGDWALKARYPLEEREMALAHAVGDAVVQSYRLPASELYTVRIPMMTKWAKFVFSKVGQ
jgi:integrase